MNTKHQKAADAQHAIAPDASFKSPADCVVWSANAVYGWVDEQVRKAEATTKPAAIEKRRT